MGPYKIADGNQSFQIIDGLDPSCFTEIVLEAPGTCSSGLCNIEIEVLSYSCQNMNTVGDQTDDEIYIDITVNSNSGGSGWVINSPQVFQGNYDTPNTIGPFGYVGVFTISISDVDNPDCSSTFQINTSGIVNDVEADGMVEYCEFDNAIPLEAIGTNLIWFDALGTEINSAPIPNTSILGTEIYSVLQSVNGCESELVDITVNVEDTPESPITADISYCIGEEAIPLTAIGENLMWYDSDFEALAEAPTPSTANEGVIEYFVTSNVNNCESETSQITVFIQPCGCEDPIIESISGDRETYCLGQLINLSVNLSPLETSGTWHVNIEGSGEFSDVEAQFTQFNPEEIGNVSV